MPNEFIYTPPLEPFLEIIHNDDAIIVVNKPSGLLSVPGRDPRHNDSIISRVRREAPDAQAVHRLDMATSGIMVVAKNSKISGILGKQFQNRSTSKIYYAWVYGEPESPEGVIKLPLITDFSNRPYQIVDFNNGREAITQYTVVFTAPDKSRSLVRLHPLTGRSHQIRVHMKEIGHPILGDHLYASPEIREMVPNLQLHAWSLTFYHPVSNQRMTFRHDPPFTVPIRLF
ncbi:pseudouridine synthase [Succinimonas amylolytica]|uniref:pseudouridine synthase n=1 Tax=Succinimonas amylolytica TaxID=83769 RepID=UPI0023A80C97